MPAIALLPELQIRLSNTATIILTRRTIPRQIFIANIVERFNSCDISNQADVAIQSNQSQTDHSPAFLIDSLVLDKFVY